MWIKMRDSGLLGLPITVTVGAVVETQLGPEGGLRLICNLLPPTRNTDP
jgi:hypothetical protein